MAGVRDPAFWKRFSVAVHLDEEQGQTRQEQGGEAGETWLAKQQRKKSRRTWVACCFWGGFCIFVAALIIVIVWYLHVTNTSSGGI